LSAALSRCSASITAFAIALVVALTAGCASVSQSPPPAPISSVDAPFSIGGRISARRGDKGVAGGFTWTHGANRDAIDLATPLGQTLARLEGSDGGVTVHLQDGRTETAPTWRELTERAFGVTIPVEGLSAWVRGVPREGAPFRFERDGSGRVSLLRQDGWEVVYAYADDVAQRPFRVSLSYPGAEPVEVRVVVDRWQ
jgi:outer membrane lipoprotein LolB